MKYDDEHLTRKQVEPAQLVSAPSAPPSLLRDLESRIDLYKHHLSAPLSQEQLLLALQHDRWEIRYAALERLGTRDEQIPAEFLASALQDESSYVRVAAQQVFEQKRIQRSESLPGQERQAFNERISSVERKQLPMSSLHSSSEAQGATDTMLPQPPGMPSRAPRKKLSLGIRLLALVATLVIVLGGLTAASFGFGWWDPMFGSPSLYTSVNQQRVDHGVTVKITSVYADEGRTIIAYDVFSKDASKEFYLNNFDLSGSMPQKHEILTGTYGERGNHFYMLQPAFIVPANVNTLTLTLNVGNMMVVTKGQGTTTMLAGTWHFVFTVPFHHMNNAQVPSPIHGDVGR